MFWFSWQNVVCVLRVIVGTTVGPINVLFRRVPPATLGSAIKIPLLRVPTTENA